jgi:uncharacterized membrane protein YjfL (UPF0719 family)
MHWQPVLDSILYAFLGVAILFVAFAIIDLLTPGRLWQELLEKQNQALAIVAAGVAIAVGLIVASAIA